MWSRVRLGYKKHSGIPVTWHSVGPIGRHTHSEATAIPSDAGPQFKLVEDSQNIDHDEQGKDCGWGTPCSILRNIEAYTIADSAAKS